MFSIDCEYTPHDQPLSPRLDFSNDLTNDCVLHVSLTSQSRHVPLVILVEPENFASALSICDNQKQVGYNMYQLNIYK